MNTNPFNPINSNSDPVAATDAAIERALESHRLLGGSRMIRTDSVHKITDEECAQVVEAVKAYLKEKGLTQVQLARALVIAPSTVNQVLKGAYLADARPLVAAMDRWLERRKNADEQPAVTRYTTTEVAKRVRLAAKRAISASDAGIDTRISLAWGDPGCGKTLAGEAVAAAEDAILITMGVAVMSPRAIMEKLADALRIGLAPSNRLSFGAIVERLHGSGKLIIVDEIHALLEARNDQAFHLLRRLSDETGCPQLWLATCNLLEELRKREKKREPLGQIISRIGCQIHLTAKLHAGPGGGGKVEPLYSVEEILAIYGANELRLTKDAGRFLARLCTNPTGGLLRTCTSLAMSATSMNRGSGGMITGAMLWEAAMTLYQESALHRMEYEMRDEIAESALQATA